MIELDLFTAALAIPEGAERDAYLERVCAGQPEMRRRLEELLAAHAGAGRFLDSGAVDGLDATGPFLPRPSAPPSTDETVTLEGPRPSRASAALNLGTVIADRFTLLELIGEGGMGSVYLADQTEPVKRQVALKLIKAGMDSRSVLARFDAERQALALMDHPNIARVYDGGTTAAGQPFFVMELVRGVPLTMYCDEKRLPLKDRLELFVAVCQAVQHAHQKGIIHRDLKPSNLLVIEVDGRPTPKVIDFGVAKAIELKLTDHSFMDAGAVVGTPAYMSPEQADPSSMDIDTRTDVYALGVILYELLVGSPPIDASQFKHGAILEMLRMVREVDPPRPSTKLSTAENLPNIAANRSIEPAKLSKSLRGELDWVVMKAIEKDRVRRYDTANGLGRDIQRYLADEMVEARPPSTPYRFRKFVRRNRGQVMAASLVFFALLAGIVGTTLGLLEARRSAEAERQAQRDADNRRMEAENERRRAEAGEKLAGDRLLEVKAEKVKVEDEKTIALAVRDFLQNKLLAQADVDRQGYSLLKPGALAAELKPNPTIRELLDRAAEELSEAKIETNFPNQPLVQAELLHTVGSTYHGVGELDKAIGLLQRSVKIRKAKLGPEAPITLTSMNNLAATYKDAGKLELAVPLFEEVLKIRKATLGPEHHETLASMNNLAVAHTESGKPDLAGPILEESLKSMKTVLGPRHPVTLKTMNNLASAYIRSGKHELALTMFKENLRLTKATVGPDHPDTITSMNNLASAYDDAGKFDLSLPICEESLKLMKAKFGPDHPATLTGMNNLATALLNAKKLDLALPLLEESLKLSKGKFAPDHPHMLNCMNNLAAAYLDAGKADLALPIYQEGLKLQKAKLGPEHPTTLGGMNNLASAYQAVGKTDMAVQLFEETIKIQKNRQGSDHPDTLKTMINLAGALAAAKQVDKAITLFKEALKIAQEKLGRNHFIALTAAANLAKTYSDVGRDQEAIPLHEEVYRARAKGDLNQCESLNCMHNLAASYWRAHQLDKSIPLFEDILKRREKTQGRDHAETLRTMVDLAASYNDAGREKDALPLLEEVYRSRGKLGDDNIVTLTCLNNLGVSYWRGKRLDKSIPIFEELLKSREKETRPRPS